MTGAAPLPLFPVSTVGSWPRPPELVRALGARRRGTMTPAQFNDIADRAVSASVEAQERAGVDLVTDGEQRRDNFYSFVAGKLEGVQLMTLAEMLDIVEDKEGFGRLLSTMDVPAFSISNPTCVGPIVRREPLALDELTFLRRITSRPIKVTLPGPYLLTRAMWVKEVTRPIYPTKEDLGEAVVGVLRDEARALEEAGVACIQFDEPVLTELVFTQGQTRTFMCAALAARKDPAEELAFAVDLINRVVEGLSRATTAVHVCRGNWSRNETTLLRGSYHPLIPSLQQMNVDQLVLEYSTPRAGAFVRVPGKSIGLGVVNPRTDEVEAPAAIVEAVRTVLHDIEPERVSLNPDCGFGTFASRPLNDAAIAEAKMKAIADAAAVLRASI